MRVRRMFQVIYGRGREALIGVIMLFSHINSFEQKVKLAQVTSQNDPCFFIVIGVFDSILS